MHAEISNVSVTTIRLLLLWVWVLLMSSEHNERYVRCWWTWWLSVDLVIVEEPQASLMPQQMPRQKWSNLCNVACCANSHAVRRRSLTRHRDVEQWERVLLVVVSHWQDFLKCKTRVALQSVKGFPQFPPASHSSPLTLTRTVDTGIFRTVHHILVAVATL